MALHHYGFRQRGSVFARLLLTCQKDRERLSSSKMRLRCFGFAPPDTLDHGLSRLDTDFDPDPLLDPQQLSALRHSQTEVMTVKLWLSGLLKSEASGPSASQSRDERKKSIR